MLVYVEVFMFPSDFPWYLLHWIPFLMILIVSPPSFISRHFDQFTRRHRILVLNAFGIPVSVVWLLFIHEFGA